MIHFRNEVRRGGADGRALKAAARRLMKALGEEGSSVSLSLVNDETMRQLNHSHRGKDIPTDVLSFPMRENHTSAQEFSGYGPPEDILGDVVISVDAAKRQAADYGAPLQRELERLLIHGLLHLIGHDHHASRERNVMEAEERRLAQCIGMPWPYRAR